MDIDILQSLKENKDIQDAVNELAELYRNELKSPSDGGRPISTGRAGGLVDFSTEVDIIGNQFVISFNLNDYWKYVENGRPSGKRPPIQEIENWIKIRNIKANSQYSSDIPDRQLAFVIARAINGWKRGEVEVPPTYKARHPLQNIKESAEYDTIKEKIESVIFNTISKKIEEEINALPFR